MTGANVGVTLATALFEQLRQLTGDEPGVTRDSYGAGEQRAHDLVWQAGERLGATVQVDAAGNLYVTRPGRNPALPAIMMGSHLDSVPHGGNYDGAAGVLAGLSIIAELDASGIVLERDLTVMATRAEEAIWFPLSYPGAEAAFGRLPASALEAPRADTGRTLADHMTEAGLDVDAVRRGERHIQPDQVAAFVELHIEQGPRLVARQLPLGLVTAINGGFRYAHARCLGAYAHSGAEPRFSRRDSVMGFVDLANGLEAMWGELEAAGHELTVTFGRLESDPAQHGGSRVLGELGFCLDVRCEHQHILDAVEARLLELCHTIAARRSVTFELGERFTWASAVMDQDLLTRLDASAARLALDTGRISSGAGHDSAVFAEMGIPSVMVFIRNTNGSHNPDEHMEMEDFAQGVQLLLEFVTSYDN